MGCGGRNILTLSIVVHTVLIGQIRLYVPAEGRRIPLRTSLRLGVEFVRKVIEGNG